MKRAVGLTTDTSKFNTTLPQTKYLNYFMKTNPVGYANGGDVRAGLPNSNMNVTKGFLPMALGFGNGGDAGKQYSLYDKLIMVLQSYVGQNVSQQEIEKKAEEIINTNPEYGEELIKKAEIESIGGGQSITDTQNNYNSRIPTESNLVAPTDTIVNTGMNQPNAMGGQTPTDTVINNVENDNGYFGENIIDSIKNNIPQGFLPENWESLTQEAKQAWIESQEYLNEKIKPKFEDINPGVIEKIGEAFKDDETVTDNQGGIANIRPEGTKKPTTGLVGANENLTETTTDTDIKNETVTDKDLKNASTEIQKNTGNEGKKKAPEWAIPLMSAGFAMMASKSPNFLTAMGEGGQKGLETLTSINKAKLDDELTSAQAAYYRGEGRSTGKEAVEGGFRGEFKNGIFVPYKDQRGNPIKATVTREYAINMLMKDDAFKNLLAMGQDGAVEREQYIETFMNMLKNTQVNLNPGVTQDDKGNLSGIKSLGKDILSEIKDIFY